MEEIWLRFEAVRFTILSLNVQRWQSSSIGIFFTITIQVSEMLQIQPGPQVIKLFSYSTQLSRNFIWLINDKMPTIVGILTFISKITTTSERLKAKKLLYFSVF